MELLHSHRHMVMCNLTTPASTLCRKSTKRGRTRGGGGGSGGKATHSISVLKGSWAAVGMYTHRRIWHTAGEGYSAFLSAVASTTAVEVDIEVPVFRAISPTALILKSQKLRTA